MPNSSLDKTASSKVRSFDDLAKTLAKNKVKGNPKEVAEHLLMDGTGSIALDGVGYALKKIPHGKSVVNGYRHIQRKLADIDIKAGNKVYNALDKSNFGKKINNAFVYNHEAPIKAKGNKAEKFIKVETPMLSAPIEKAKKAGLPLAGGMYLADKMLGSSDNKNKGGDTVKAANLSKREELMEKIATHIAGSNSTTTTVSSGANSKNSELMSKAAQLLKFAAEERRQYLSDNEKLASENKMLHLELQRRDKADKAIKLAKDMNEKGMIKKADIEKKAEEIMYLDNDAYELLKMATEKVQLKNEKDGVDNLTFLTEDYNIKSSKKTLADAIEED